MKFFDHCRSERACKERYRRLAKLFHPDVGGDKEFMQLLNEQWAELEEEDEIGGMLDAVLIYASRNSKFDSSFVDSLAGVYANSGQLSSGQLAALRRIIRRFGIRV